MKNVLIILFGLAIVGCQNPKQEKQVVQDYDQPYEETAILEDEDCDKNFYEFFLEQIVFDGIQPQRVKVENFRNEDIHPQKEFYFQIGKEGMTRIGFIDEDQTYKKHLTKFSASNSMVTDYLFEKIDCKWYLTSIIKQNVEINKNKEFLTFLYNFSTDSVFRVNNIRFPLKIGYLDDDFFEMEKFVSVDETPRHNFFNDEIIVFLHDGNLFKSTIIISYTGTNNGINGFYVFEYTNGTWFLTEDNDFSV